MPLIEGALVRPTMTRFGSWRAASAARILPMPSSRLTSRAFAFAESGGQRRVLDGEAGHARGLELQDRAHDIQGIAVAVVGIDQERQLRGARDAQRLRRELAQR